MTSFVVQELRLLSRKEKSAFRMSFHPRATVIRGENDTGKSSIIKSIFWCFGAEPAKTSDRWDDLDICGAVRFSINGRVLTIVRHGRKFGIFDEGGFILNTFSRITHGLGPYLADLFGFGLLLSSKDGGEPETPPPAYYLLPYYIDQDAGWKDTWCSFAKLAQYRDWKGDVAEYHIGLRDNRYYQLKTAIAANRAAMDEPKRQEGALVGAIEQVRMRMAEMPVDFNLSRFQREVDELVGMATGLASDEERHRRRAGELSNKRAFLTQQIDLARHALGELNRDYVYSLKQSNEVECPTCGATYENSVVERFRIARDENQCTDLLTDFRKEIGDIDAELSSLRNYTASARERHSRIWELLDIKRNTMSLHEVLQGEARGQALSALQAEIDGVRGVLHGLEEQIEKTQESLKAFDSKERKRDIMARFSSTLNRYAIALRIAAPGAVRSFHFKINETGSDLPRAVLAYSFAVLSFAWVNREFARAPLILDSPNQQDQDPANLLTMLTFIRDQVPIGQQLILGLVDPQGVDFGGSEVVLEHKWKALSEDLYNSVGRDLQDMASKMYEHSEVSE